jgi:outer membrane protein
MSVLLWLAVAAVPDLTLEAAIEAAMTGAQDIVRAKEDLLLADVDRMRSLAAVLPQINFSAAANEYFYGHGYVEARTNYFGRFTDSPIDEYSHPNFNAAISARQLIFDGGRWWTVLARSKDVRTFRVAAVDTVGANLRLLVVRRFYDLAKALRGVETFSVQVKMDEEQLKRAREQLEAGRGRQNDVAAAERNLSANRVTLARRRFAESTRTRLLNLTIGREPDSGLLLVIPKEVVTTTSSLKPIIIPRSDLLVEEAIRERPEISGSLANLQILRKNVVIRRADNYPIVALNTVYSRSSRQPDRVFGDPTWNYFAALGLDIRWNLFSGYATQASVEEGEVEVRKAEVLHADLERQIRAEVLEKIEQLRLLAQVFELNRLGARSAEEAQRQVNAAYRENRATLLELADAQFRLITARDAIYEARFDLEVAIEELRRAVGREVRDRADVPVQEIP